MIAKRTLREAVPGDGDAAPADVRILLVDDRPENLLALTAILEGTGRTLLTASSGREALRVLLKQEVAVILLDVNMPEMDGFETAALIRQRPASSHTPIIFVTAHVDEGHVLKAYSLGAVDYILAPINADVLRAKVSVFVDLHRKTVANREQADRLRRAEEQLRRQAEQRLRETDARLQQVIDSVVDYAIFSLDVDGCIATWNAGAQRLFLYPESEVIGRGIAMLLAPGDMPDLAAQQCGRAIAQGRAELDTWFRRKDGSRFYGTGLVTPMRGPGGELMGFSNVTRDITERRRAEEALQQKAEELAEANRVKDEFLAVLSHELRTPLNAIIGWAHMLLDRRMDTESVRRGLESIARNGKLQLNLVNDILDVSRCVTGKFRLDVSPFDMRMVAEAAVETGRTAAHAKGITLDARLPDAPVTVDGDAGRLQQVAWNLISNAVKFTQPGGRVIVDVEAGEQTMTLTVTDNGIGIQPQFLPYVFDRFRQADSSSSRASGGLGLGLAIVKHIVELHGGSVKAHSDGDGRGATFTVCLPLTQKRAVTDAQPQPANAPVEERAAMAEQAEPAARGDAPQQVTRPLGDLRCLVVDDDDDTRDLLKTALEQHGARVRVAASASDAMALVSGADVLVSDLAMPNEDGYAMIRKVRALPPREGGAIPAIALSAHAGETDRARAMQAGFQMHVAKPVSPARLVQAIDELMSAVQK